MTGASFNILLIIGCLALWGLVALVLWGISENTAFERIPRSEIEFQD